MKELYFVSYSYVGGFGSCEIWRDNGGFNVRKTSKAIEEEEGFKNVIILYFKKFENGESY